MSEVCNMNEFQYVILPNGKKRYYREPDMSRVDKATAEFIINAIQNREKYDAKISKLKQQIAKEDAELRALIDQGAKI